MWLAHSGAIYSRIAPSFALNRIVFSTNGNWTVKGFFKLTNRNAGTWKTKKAIVWQIWLLNCTTGSNKVAIELRVVQFWSEIMICDLKSNSRCTLLRFLNHASNFRPNCTPLSSITIINVLILLASNDLSVMTAYLTCTPIASTNTGSTERISSFVNSLLKPIPIKQDSYIYTWIS